MTDVDELPVVVVGAGNAGLTAAISAAEHGRRVVVIDAAPERAAGGNSWYTAGATRIVHGGLDDLAAFVREDPRTDRAIVPPYTKEDYRSDLERVTGGRNDPFLTDVLVDESASAVRWLSSHGVRYQLMFERQAYERDDGRFQFWGGLHIGNVGGGKGLVRDEVAAAERLGIEILYDTTATRLVEEDGRIAAVELMHAGRRRRLECRALVLAAGGFEANAELRAAYLGQQWRRARVRGTPYNDGGMLVEALRLGAARAGDWSSCHSVAWDADHADNESNADLTNRLTRQSYPLGIVVNTAGTRFIDEGADFRNYTYAKYGREILRQPGARAFQIFDATTAPMLRSEEYMMPGVSVVEADTVEALAAAAGIDPEGLVRTVVEYNTGIDRSRAFDPNVLDQRSSAVQPPKSNWALAIETPPFRAYPVTCGITFTFGGLKTDPDGRVLRADGRRIAGLFAAGEMLGGLFAGNYPGGSGLAAGMVFGRRAGRAAAVGLDADEHRNGWG